MTNRSKTVILASSSPRRAQLVRALGLTPRIIPSSADETFDPAMAPKDVVVHLARCKAEAVCAQLRNEAGQVEGIVIGADTIVVIDGKILGKPVSPAHAVSMLLELQGRTHEVYTGLAVMDASSGVMMADYRVTKVRMKANSRQRLERYVATGEPMDKAGAYGIQELGAVLVESIDGDYFTVVGLPVALLSDMLENFGVAVM